MASRMPASGIWSPIMDGNLHLNAKALDRARMSRDARFDGKFFIAVTSTRIYCRPICPSPHAKRANVRYFPSAASAAAAGFRPCLRCRPEAAPGTAAWMGTSAVVRRALRLIEDGFLDHDSVDELAARLGIGARHLHRLFVRHVGAPAVAVAQTRRLHFAKHLIDETQLPITDVAFAAGFQSIRRFNSAFQETFRRSPRELRRQRSGETAGNEDEVCLKLSYRPPYDWAQVRDFLAFRALPGIEVVEEGAYTRTVSCGKTHAIIRLRPLAGEHSLELRVRGAAPADLLQISSIARRAFDVSADPALINAALRTDPVLGNCVQQRPGLRIVGAWSLFECAVRAIVGQQVSVAGARTLLTRLVERAGRRVATGVTGLTYLFPSPRDLATADLNGIGLTEMRKTALRAIAHAMLTGKLNAESPAETLCAELAALPGIGEWTAQYVALRALGEPDAFPSSDLVLRKMAARDSTALSLSALESKAEAWRPWRGYAAMHLWRAAAKKL
jgi:AraC family transcriptional regulator of adaptative response / DNA-3-methyladenine glycosylase II